MDGVGVGQVQEADVGKGLNRGQRDGKEEARQKAFQLGRCQEKWV